MFPPPICLKIAIVPETHFPFSQFFPDFPTTTIPEDLSQLILEIALFSSQPRFPTLASKLQTVFLSSKKRQNKIWVLGFYGKTQAIPSKSAFIEEMSLMRRKTSQMCLGQDAAVRVTNQQDSTLAPIKRPCPQGTNTWAVRKFARLINKPSRWTLPDHIGANCQSDNLIWIFYWTLFPYPDMLYPFKSILTCRCWFVN